MAQVTGWPGSGIRLATGIAIFTGVGDPNVSSAVDIQQAGVGSLYLRSDVVDSTHQLYVCTTAGISATPTQSQVNAVWTPK
jgi:hypothetical protein